ncbi:unannotated protein [freshwater metagenome]|uniref:Unannotated protein n=1 Tax=freshwater metagenome TaxID=449393 RepID=A0A6J7KSA6_9ZZZZ
MVQTAMKIPTCQNDQPITVRRYTGSPTTNQTSRDAKRKIRAPARRFTDRLLENICRNFADASGVPRSPRMKINVPARPAATRPAMHPSAAWKPMTVRSRPPRKKPTPLSAFLEPVRIATHL